MDHPPRDHSAKLILASVPVQVLLMAGAAALAFGGISASPAQNAFVKPVPGQVACKDAVTGAPDSPAPGAVYKLAQVPGGRIYATVNDGKGPPAWTVCRYTPAPGFYKPGPGIPDAPAQPAKP
jgi:hypothetical protein